MTSGQGIAPDDVTSASVEDDAKDRATAVVVSWRSVDWQAIEGGDVAALAALRIAAETHESTLRFLLDDAGEVGDKLAAGIERYYAKDVGPMLRKPSVLSRLAAQAEPESPKVMSEEEDSLIPRKRPSVTVGHTVRMNTGCGNLYVTVNESDDGQPFELFNHMGKAGGCAASQNEAIGRLISYALRCGASLEPMIKQLKGISCHRPAWGEDGKISSCSDAIGKALEKYYTSRIARKLPEVSGGPSDGTSTDFAPEDRDRALPDELDLRREALSAASDGNGKRTIDAPKVQGACPDCGSQMSYEEGCVKCHSCGFTECG